MSVAFALAAPTLAAQQTCPAVEPGATMPLKYQGGPTVAAITPCDLMTRLYIYADDSLRGREAGTPDAMRATAYIEREVRKLGLKPAGDHGSYFQNMPVTARSVTPASTMTAGGKTFHADRDFVLSAPPADHKVSAAVIFGGTLGDTTAELTADQAKGKIVVMMAPAGGSRGFFRRAPGSANPLADAAAIVTVTETLAKPRFQPTLNDTVQNTGREAYAASHPNEGNARGGRGGFGGAGLNITVTPQVASALLGKSVESAALGDAGPSATIDIHVKTAAAPTRSVVAILPGTDPKLSKRVHRYRRTRGSHRCFGRASRRRARFTQGVQRSCARRRCRHSDRAGADGGAVGAHQCDQGFATQDLSAAARLDQQRCG